MLSMRFVAAIVANCFRHLVQCTKMHLSNVSCIYGSSYQWL